jgi:hypothetical protein
LAENENENKNEAGKIVVKDGRRLFTTTVEDAPPAAQQPFQLSAKTLAEQRVGAKRLNAYRPPSK